MQHRFSSITIHTQQAKKKLYYFVIKVKLRLRQGAFELLKHHHNPSPINANSEHFPFIIIICFQLHFCLSLFSSTSSVQCTGIYLVVVYATMFDTGICVTIANAETAANSICNSIIKLEYWLLAGKELERVGERAHQLFYGEFHY